MSSELDRQSLIDIFVMEASEAAAALSAAVNPSGDALPTAEELQNQYVWAHKVRGAAGIYGFTGLSTLGALLESMLEQGTTIDSALWPKAVGALRGMVEAFQSQLEIVRQNGQEDLTVADRWKVEVGALLPETTEEGSNETGDSEPLSSTYLVPSIDADVLSYFAPEADEYLQTMESLVHRLADTPGDQETIHALYRTAHTLKGSAHTIGFKVVGDVAHPIEDCMIAMREGRIAASAVLLETIGQAMNVIRLLMRRDDNKIAQLQHDVPQVTEALTQISKGEINIKSAVAAKPDLPVATAVAVMDPPAKSEEQGATTPVAISQLTDEYLLPQLDPEVLSYFAPEAHEYLESLEAQLLRLEKEPNNPELINQLFRTAHTLKGSAYTVGFQSIGDLTHYVEDFMGAVREGRVKVLPGHADMLLRAVDVVRLLLRRDPTLTETVRQRFVVAMQGLKQLEQQPIGVAANVQTPVSQPVQVATAKEPRDQSEAESAKTADGKGKDGGSEDREVIRVSRDRLERLLNLVGELVIGRGRLEQRLSVLEQLSQQVLACKGRLMDSVRSFEEKHTFTLPSAGSGSQDAAGTRAGAAAFPGISDFGSLEFDKYDDFNILARRISEVTADISESMSQLSGSIRRSH
ncbi:MAG TPA: Hpt domain-containing protein [Nitrospira sp.]